MAKTKLELTWIGKENRPQLEPRILLEDAARSYFAPQRVTEKDQFDNRKFVTRRYRNRRIGEFLKELDMTEGRSTGVPKIYHAMARNGSPRPKFEADEGRFWFRAELPIHKGFAAEARAKRPKSGPSRAQVDAQELSDIERRILTVLKRQPLATQAIAAALGHASLSGAAKLALSRLESARLIELTIPDKPRSRLQTRRLTPAGKAALAAIELES